MNVTDSGEAVKLTFFDPFEARRLRRAIAPELGRLARLKFGFDTWRGILRPVLSLSGHLRAVGPPAPVTVNLSPSQLPAVATALDSQIEMLTPDAQAPIPNCDFPPARAETILRAQEDFAIATQARHAIATHFESNAA